MAKKKTAQERAQIFFTGRVQGVGFRYTAERIALDLKLTGWVKNLPDGRVEVLCEGTKEQIESFTSKIKESHLGPHIKKTALSWQKATSEFDDFRVEFYL